MTNKERNLIKGALRRVFSRSELRRKIVEKSTLHNYSESTRPRVKKWSLCPECKNATPTYLMQVDHIKPVLKVTETLETISWDTLVARLWCDEKNLVAICKPCHNVKTKAENKLRRQYKKEQKANVKSN